MKDDIKDNIQVEHGTTEHGEHTTVIADHQGKRAWSGVGKTQNEASTEATRKFLGDQKSREYMPR